MCAQSAIQSNSVAHCSGLASLSLSSTERIRTSHEGLEHKHARAHTQTYYKRTKAKTKLCQYAATNAVLHWSGDEDAPIAGFPLLLLHTTISSMNQLFNHSYLFHICPDPLNWWEATFFLRSERLQRWRTEQIQAEVIVANAHKWKTQETKLFLQDLRTSSTHFFVPESTDIVPLIIAIIAVCPLGSCIWYVGQQLHIK